MVFCVQEIKRAEQVVQHSDLIRLQEGGRSQPCPDARMQGSRSSSSREPEAETAAAAALFPSWLEWPDRVSFEVIPTESKYKYWAGLVRLRGGRHSHDLSCPSAFCRLPSHLSSHERMMCIFEIF